jgi:hypothetical protein
MKNIATIIFLTIISNILNAEIINKKFDPEAWYIIDVYLDADLNETTGMKSNWLYTSSGIDYMAQGPFIYKYTGTPGTNEWNWTDLSSVKRMCSFDSTFVEGLISTNSIVNPSLNNKFGISFPYYLQNATAADIIYFPENNDAFQQKKLFKYKLRPKNDLNTHAELLSENAYYHPFMNDPDIVHYLNFASTGNKEDKSMQWVSWALQINFPAIYDVTFTMQNSEPAVLNLSLIDMSTNLVVKSFTEMIVSQVHSQFTNINTGKINLSDIPAGNYMLKLKDNSDFTNNVKVEKISLTQEPSDVTNFLNDIYKISSHSGIISVQGSIPFDVYIFSLDGKTRATSFNNKKHNIHQDKGVYLLQIIAQNKIIVRKAIVL